MKKLENSSEQYGKASFKYAWVMDQTFDSRHAGITNDTSLKNLQTSKYNCTLIDVPGLSNYLKNTTKGISQGDCALLCVSASRQ